MSHRTIFHKACCIALSMPEAYTPVLMCQGYIRQIDYNLVDNFIAEIHVEKGLSQSSLKKYVVLVRKVLKEAERDGTIDHIPTLPTIKRTENPRPWFSPCLSG